MNNNLTIGVIGAGRIGKIHAKNISTRIPGVIIKTICDLQIQSARDLAKEISVSNVTDNPKVIFEDTDIQAVIICSSTDTHSSFIIQSALAGKHIFCEKPIDQKITEIDRVLTAVEKAGVKLQIGFNRRFDANYKKVREMIFTGNIGKPEILRITSRDPAPPPISYIKSSGGIFMDMTIHDFDMARFLMGCEVKEVFTAGGVMVDKQIGEAGDIDTAIITLFFENGAIGTIDNSRRAVYGYDQRVEAFGSEGMVSIGNNLSDTHMVFRADGVSSSKPLYFFLERYLDSYAQEIIEFVDAVRNNTPTPVTGMDGRKPVLIAEAAKKSYLEKKVVSVER